MIDACDGHCGATPSRPTSDSTRAKPDKRNTAFRLVMRIPRLLLDRLLRPRNARRFALAHAGLLARLREPMPGSITLDAEVMARVVASARGGHAPLTQSETHDMVATGEHIAAGLLDGDTHRLAPGGSPLTLQVDRDHVVVQSCNYTTRALSWYVVACAARLDLAREAAATPSRDDGMGDYANSGCFKARDPHQQMFRFLAAAPTAGRCGAAHFATRLSSHGERELFLRIKAGTREGQAAVQARRSLETPLELTPKPVRDGGGLRALSQQQQALFDRRLLAPFAKGASDARDAQLPVVARIFALEFHRNLVVIDGRRFERGDLREGALALLTLCGGDLSQCFRASAVINHRALFVLMDFEAEGQLSNGRAMPRGFSLAREEHKQASFHVDRLDDGAIHVRFDYHVERITGVRTVDRDDDRICPADPMQSRMFYSFSMRVDAAPDHAVTRAAPLTYVSRIVPARA